MHTKSQFCSLDMQIFPAPFPWAEVPSAPPTLLAAATISHVSPRLRSSPRRTSQRMHFDNFHSIRLRANAVQNFRKITSGDCGINSVRHYVIRQHTVWLIQEGDKAIYLALSCRRTFKDGSTHSKCRVLQNAKFCKIIGFAK